MILLQREATIAGAHRYRLFRRWKEALKRAVFIGLNPSVANALRDDPTVRVCMGFADRWGCGEFVIVNLFGLIATDPAELATHPDPVGVANDGFIYEAAREADILVAAWGDGGGRLGAARARAVMGILACRDVRCLGITKSGAPRHPLRVAYSTPLVPYVLKVA